MYEYYNIIKLCFYYYYYNVHDIPPHHQQFTFENKITFSTLFFCYFLLYFKMDFPEEQIYVVHTTPNIIRFSIHSLAQVYCKYCTGVGTSKVPFIHNSVSDSAPYFFLLFFYTALLWKGFSAVSVQHQCSFSAIRNYQQKFFSIFLRNG